MMFVYRFVGNTMAAVNVNTHARDLAKRLALSRVYLLLFYTRLWF